MLDVALLIAIAIAIIMILRARRQLAVLAIQIRQLREHAVRPLTYRPVESVELDKGLDDQLELTARAAERAGFTMLGDYVEESPVREGGMPMRWFIDGKGTTFGWMAPFDVSGARQIVVVLMSHELASQTITSRAPKASALSRPPFVHVQHVDPTTSFEDVVAKHRQLAQLDDDSRGFVPVRSFEQLSHELERMRGKVIAWRQAQDRDELLEADLRSLLGGQYRRLGKAMRRRVAG